MNGPEFLKLYAAIIFVVCLWAAWHTWAAEPRPNADRPPPSPPLNPREWAFLRGESEEVLRLTVLGLVARGHLQILNPPSIWSRNTVEIGPAEAPPDSPRLDPLETSLLRFFEEPKAPAQIFQDQELGTHAAAIGRDAEPRLTEAGFLYPPELRRRGCIDTYRAAGIILGLGALRLFQALSKGNDHVGFLIGLGVVGTLVAAVACHVPRLTPAGRARLGSQQDDCAELKHRLTELHQPLDIPSLILVVALFGFTVLQGTPYAKLADAFPQAAAQGGCGGGCGGGSGCGGGCGGCGGCG